MKDLFASLLTEAQQTKNENFVGGGRLVHFDTRCKKKMVWLICYRSFWSALYYCLISSSSPTMIAVQNCCTVDKRKRYSGAGGGGGGVCDLRTGIDTIQDESHKFVHRRSDGVNI